MAVLGFFVIQGNVAALRQVEGVKVYPVRPDSAMAMLDGESLHHIDQLLTKIKAVPSVSLVTGWYVLSIRG